uniref:Uncharacterized protein n=1 Tax=Triticum urartu TaxID=4572 RepID=A0A8R7P4J2_TRIUA
MQILCDFHGASWEMQRVEVNSIFEFIMEDFVAWFWPCVIPVSQK